MPVDLGFHQHAIVKRHLVDQAFEVLFRVSCRQTPRAEAQRPLPGPCRFDRRVGCGVGRSRVWGIRRRTGDACVKFEFLAETAAAAFLSEHDVPPRGTISLRGGHLNG